MEKVKSIRRSIIVCLFIWLVTLPLVVGAFNYDNDVDLAIDKTSFAPGEEIRVRFHGNGNWPGDAWIGIIPSGIQHGSEAVNDQHDITYQYINKRTHGVMVFTAPGEGQWDFRMHDTDSNGHEAAYVSFNVGSTIPVSSDSKLTLGKTAFSPGETIRVEFHVAGNWPADAWIGIIPSGIQHGSEAVNDQHDITYQYINKRTHGVMEFAAPGPGRWDLRMHDTDSNGREITSVSFTVQ